MSLKAHDVFVPGAYPQYTYVPRESEGLEGTLKDSLNTPGQIISLSGPSKSGKTVLVERVVGRDLLTQFRVHRSAHRRTFGIASSIGLMYPIRRQEERLVGGASGPTSGSREKQSEKRNLGKSANDLD